MHGRVAVMSAPRKYPEERGAAESVWVVGWGGSLMACLGCLDRDLVFEEIETLVP